MKKYLFYLLITPAYFVYSNDIKEDDTSNTQPTFAYCPDMATTHQKLEENNSLLKQLVTNSAQQNEQKVLLSLNNLELGNQSLLKNDYNKAIIEYQKRLAFVPNCTSAKNGLQIAQMLQEQELQQQVKLQQEQENQQAMWDNLHWPKKACLITVSLGYQAVQFYITNILLPEIIQKAGGKMNQKLFTITDETFAPLGCRPFESLGSLSQEQRILKKVEHDYHQTAPKLSDEEMYDILMRKYTEQQTQVRSEHNAQERQNAYFNSRLGVNSRQVTELKVKLEKAVETKNMMDIYESFSHQNSQDNSDNVSDDRVIPVSRQE